MERKYKLTILPLFEEELNHIVDYITYVLHNREAAHQLITDIEAAIYTRLSHPPKRRHLRPYPELRNNVDDRSGRGARPRCGETR